MLFPGARLGNCLRHAINKLPKKLAAIASPVRTTLRSQFHTLLYRVRQRKGLRVFALGQRLRHFANLVATTAGAANGKRVQHWFQDKKAGWYAVLADSPDAGDQHPARSGPSRHRSETLYDEGFPSSGRQPTSVSKGPGSPVQPRAVSASRPACWATRGGSRRRHSPDTRLVPQPANPHLRGLSSRKLSTCPSRKPEDMNILDFFRSCPHPGPMHFRSVYRPL
jgi:hypothetical protein